MRQWIGQQLGVDPACWPQYAKREETRREHLLESRAQFDLSPFNVSHYRTVVYALVSLAMQTDKGVVLAQALVEHLRRQGNLLPRGGGHRAHLRRGDHARHAPDLSDTAHERQTRPRRTAGTGRAPFARRDPDRTQEHRVEVHDSEILEGARGGRVNPGGAASERRIAARPPQTLVGQLETQLQAEAQEIVDAKDAAAAIERQQASTEREKLGTELDRLRALLAETNAALSREQAAHTETRDVAQQHALECERLGQRLRDQEARRHEQQVQQLQAELRQVGQTLIVKQNEITQLNKDNGRLVSEALAAKMQLRKTQEHATQQQDALTQLRVDCARLETELDTLRATTNVQSGELARVREELEIATGDRTKLVAQADALQLLLDDYRTRLGQQGSTS